MAGMYKLERRDENRPNQRREYEMIEEPELNLMASSLLVILKEPVEAVNDVFQDFKFTVRGMMDLNPLLLAPQKCRKHRCKYVCPIVAGDLFPYLCEDEACSEKLAAAMDLFEDTHEYKKFVLQMLHLESDYRARVEELLADIDGLFSKDYDFMTDVLIRYTYNTILFSQDPWPVDYAMNTGKIHDLLRDLHNPHCFSFSLATFETTEEGMTRDERQWYLVTAARDRLYAKIKCRSTGYPVIHIPGRPLTPDSEEEDPMAHPEDEIDEIEQVD